MSRFQIEAMAAVRDCVLKGLPQTLEPIKGTRGAAYSAATGAASSMNWDIHLLRRRTACR